MLKDKSGVGMIHDRIQSDTAMDGVSYRFSPSPCGIAYSDKRFMRSDVISLKEFVSFSMITHSRHTVNGVDLFNGFAYFW